MADLTHVVSEEGYDSKPSEIYSSNPHDYRERLIKELGEDAVKEVDDVLEDLTVDQLRCLERYISECCRAMTKELEKTVTMSDFEAVKKDDSEEKGEY